MDELREKKEIEKSEAIDKTAKVISSLIPGGGSVYETFRALVTPLHEKKQKEWQKDVIKRLAKLEQEEKIDLEELQNDEEFNAIITRATVLTLQNHQKEKLDALRNVVINSAIDDEIDFDLKHYFLLFIDQISPLHILLLKIFKDPGSYASKRGVEIGNMMATSAMSTLKKIQPDLEEKEQLVELAWDDLSDMKLVTTDSLKAMASGNAAEQGSVN
ncbi:hypothetical protein [Halalkalibaculum sp. DA384]|uniref:hypothetical protein n=1 Tax=Halalkalibaculum sp. DA384 TaxID=3373606 RepID=UPI00375464FD